jgi:hypothetical protein
LKFTVKEFERNSKKCDKEEKLERTKLKKAIQKGNMEVARIHGENAIRQKNQSLNFLRMAARIDAVASRVQTAVTTKKVLGSLLDLYHMVRIPKFSYLKGHTIDGWCCQSNGQCYAIHELGEDFGFDGQV